MYDQCPKCKDEGYLTYQGSMQVMYKGEVHTVEHRLCHICSLHFDEVFAVPHPDEADKKSYVITIIPFENDVIYYELHL